VVVYSRIRLQVLRGEMKEIGTGQKGKGNKSINASSIICKCVLLLHIVILWHFEHDTCTTAAL
jgi:hypothetical protein